MVERCVSHVDQDTVSATISRTERRQYLWLLPLWLGAVAVGMGMLFAYSLTPGAAAQPPEIWPASTQLRLSEGKSTIVLVAHPRCPCTRASISELSWLMSRLQGQVEGYVLFVKPQGVGRNWEQTDLWRSASILDGVQVIADEGGVESKKFGAYTSGQVYLYDRQGALMFSGGITPTRSHQGDNVGRRRVVHYVTQGSAERDTSAVYGCALNDEVSSESWLLRLTAAALAG